jgi:hypothetical protein
LSDIADEEFYNIVAEFREMFETNNCCRQWVENVNGTGIPILESREIPSEYENPLMFDRCYEEEEDGTIFGIKIEPNFERHGLPRQQRRIQQEKGS